MTLLAMSDMIQGLTIVQFMAALSLRECVVKCVTIVNGTRRLEFIEGEETTYISLGARDIPYSNSTSN